MYSSRSSIETSDDRPAPRSSRRLRRSHISDLECNVNNSNNVDDGANTKATLDLPDKSRRPSDSKSPARNRKSKLIETMAANFEKKNTDNRHVSGSQRSVPNGDSKSVPSDPAPTEPSAAEELEATPPESKKSGPSARRGKLQREKRMLRQKRRSTGVVNKKDLEESEKRDYNEAEQELQNETDSNTQTNELSPVSNHPPTSRISVTKTDSHSTRSAKSNNTYESSPTSASKGNHLSSQRHHVARSDDSSNTKVSSNHSDVDELRAKLETAEITISKLRKEIKAMNNELHVLEEENHQLKEDNKMLEDENKTMLRIIRR